MADIYDDFQELSNELFEEFQQGTVKLIRTTEGVPANEWEAGTPTTVEFLLSATATGVLEKYVDGKTILSSDLQINSAVKATNLTTGIAVDLIGSNQPSKETDKLEIDGSVKTVEAIKQIPSAGTPVTLIFFVRG